MDKYLRVRDGVELRYKFDRADNPKGLVLINHGFAEHMDRYEDLAKNLAQGSYSTYRYDLRGHGLTRSKKGHIDSYRDFIEDAHEMVELAKKENPGLDLYMFGHSMGGFITCAYGLTYPRSLKGQIFSGPAVNTIPAARGIKGKALDFMGRNFENFRIKNMIVDDICSLDQVVEDFKNDPLVLKDASVKFLRQFLIEGVDFIGKNIETYKYPCLILHGEDDKIVPKEVGEYLYENISSEDKELIIYDNLYHEILNEEEGPQVIKDIIDWLDAHS